MLHSELHATGVDVKASASSEPNLSPTDIPYPSQRLLTLVINSNPEVLSPLPEFSGLGTGLRCATEREDFLLAA